MLSALSHRDGADDQRDDSNVVNNTVADSTFVGMLYCERRTMKRSLERSKSNDLSSKPVAPTDIDSPPFQRSCIALRLLYDAQEYAQQLGRVCWDFAEEIDSLHQHGLTNGDLRWLVCNGLVEHGREITESGQEGRTFHPDRGLCFSSKTCFVLTERGAAHLTHCLNAPTDDPSALPTPVWDRDLQELRVGTTIVKRFKVPARNQETILAAFQEENWPVFIDDPLPPHSNIDPKRHLHDTINSLNRNQKNDLIRFRGNGSGEGIRWEFVQPFESAD